MKKILISFIGLSLTVVSFNQCQSPRKDAETSAGEGGKLFVQYCSRCHSDKGMGGVAPDGAVAPDIRKYNRTAADIIWIVSNGYGRMPSLKDSISTDNIAKIAAYVSAQIEYHASSSNTISATQGAADTSKMK